MSRNSTILLHKCFDPSKLDYESAGTMVNAFVRFPKRDCTCSERVRLSERNAMLDAGDAVVVLRDLAVPSADKFTWKEIVAVTSRKQYAHAPQARTISKPDIERAYAGGYNRAFR